MKPRTSAAWLVVAAALAGALGCAATARPEPEHAAPHFDDAVLTSRVKAALHGEASLRRAEITVTTVERMVHLSGWVGTRAGAVAAVELSRTVNGVLGVTSALRVRQ